MRTAGMAYVVVETARNLDLVSGNPEADVESFRQRLTAYATTWGLSRNMPVDTDEEVAAAVDDARKYVDEHSDDLAEFLRLTGR